MEPHYNSIYQVAELSRESKGIDYKGQFRKDRSTRWFYSCFPLLFSLVSATQPNQCLRLMRFVLANYSQETPWRAYQIRHANHPIHLSIPKNRHSSRAVVKAFTSQPHKKKACPSLTFVSYCPVKHTRQRVWLQHGRSMYKSHLGGYIYMTAFAQRNIFSSVQLPHRILRYKQT